MWCHPRTRRRPALERSALALSALLALAVLARADDDKAPKDDAQPAAEAPEARTDRKDRAGAKDAPKPPPVINASLLKSPVSHRVYQRSHDGKAEIAVDIDEAAGVEDAQVVGASLVNVVPVSQVRFEGDKFVGVPTGGPYTVQVAIRVGDLVNTVQVPNVYVGDVWVLAGQSNMEGVGDLIDVTPPNEQVMLLGMDGTWRQAEEPLHWLVDSPDPVHSGNPADRAQRSAEQHKTRTKGAGLGLPFGVALAQATGVPIGLVATAHGGTSMEQWSPSRKGEGGQSLYGSMLRLVNLAGGKVKGVLWYQGESDAMSPEATQVYPKTFADFIKAVRDDLGQPDLPFYFVQIGRFIHDGSPKDWNAVQDAERRLAESVPNTAVVATVDLELDDLIHVGTQGQKRVGRRLANVALRELYGQVGATTPAFDRVTKGPGNTLVVKFKGVNITHEPNALTGPAARGGGFRQAGVRPGVTRSPVVGLKPSRHIAGFSIRKDDGTEIPLIFDAAVGNARDAVVLKLIGEVPEGASLWYGHGYNPYCNLTDALDMAVPVFGPIPLDDVR